MIELTREYVRRQDEAVRALNDVKAEVEQLRRALDYIADGNASLVKAALLRTKLDMTAPRSE